MHTHAHACTCTHTCVHSLRKTAEVGPGSTQVLYFLHQHTHTHTHTLTSNRSVRGTAGIRADTSGVLGPDSTVYKYRGGEGKTPRRGNKGH